MHVKLNLLGLALVVATLGGCTSLKVNSDYDSSTDFERYRTYSFISDNPLQATELSGISPLLEGRLMRAARRELDAKGYRFAEDREQADFVVSFTLGARDKIKVTNYPATYHGGYFGGWGAPYYNEVDVRNYTEGTLAIDLFDVNKRGPVWHGWAVKSITSSDRQNPEPLINEVVMSILAQFPPGAAG